MADSESFPAYLNLDVESFKSFYESSSTLLETLKQFNSTLDLYIDDYIAYNNAKTSPQPTVNKISALTNAFSKVDQMPVGVAYDWYKKINNQIDAVKSATIQLCGEDFKQISDSIGSIGTGFTSYNNNTTPYYSYNMDNIRPNFYIPPNTFNKIHPKAYGNLIEASKYLDYLFDHNLAPACGEKDVNLIQSTGVWEYEGNAAMYSGKAYSLTAHGDNLITDVNTITGNEQFKSFIKTQISTVYKKLHKIIGAIKCRGLINTTFERTSENIQFETVAGLNIDSESDIWESLDILQNKIVDFDKSITIDACLK